MGFVTENELDQWMLGHVQSAPAVLADLVARLVIASSDKPKERRFPLGDSIGQPGKDGYLDAVVDYEPFVPSGASCWEFGAGGDPQKKATSDYEKRTQSVTPEERLRATFVFVTPLSGRHWSEAKQKKWIESRKSKSEWKDVRIIDGTKLVDWIHKFLAIEIWLKQIITDTKFSGLETASQRWELLSSCGEPPPLKPDLFLINRDDAVEKVRSVFDDQVTQLKISTHFPSQASDFVCAYVAALKDEERLRAESRCLFVSSVEGWEAACLMRQLVLVVDSGFDLSGDSGFRLIQKARKANHYIIFSEPPGGVPQPQSIQLASPKIYQIEEALKTNGYPDERARVLAQKSGGNLTSLLRCVQSLSTMPEWAEGSVSAELVVAALLGQWTESKAEDKAVVGNIAGKAYGEWIKSLRVYLQDSSIPLSHKDGVWKFISRYEGWYFLGPKIFDDQLDRLKIEALNVLGQVDPKFDLKVAERYAAGIYGKVLSHSASLRKGLAESLALLGSQSQALTSCSLGKAEATAAVVVRELLSTSDWMKWASLDDLLPLLAEAAPEVFLYQVEESLKVNPGLFDSLFLQEGDGLSGGTVISGLLWALETLAWDRDLLPRVTLCLGALAARDPGGRYLNRPANSLRSIYLPWLPQTTAPLETRLSIVKALIVEHEKVAWDLLLALLPETHSTSSYTRKPAWRNFIPDLWRVEVTNGEYSKQVDGYSSLALEMAKESPRKLIDLVGRIDHLPRQTYEALILVLKSESMIPLSEKEKDDLWRELSDFVRKHRRFADSNWAMPEDEVSRFDEILKRLEPTSFAQKNKGLFGDREYDLYEEKGNYEEQRKRFELLRQEVIRNLLLDGLEQVLMFVQVVDSPWRVGTALGFVANEEVDSILLPRYVRSEDSKLMNFCAGFITARFHAKGIEWVDAKDFSDWCIEDVGQLLSYLPFSKDTWERVVRFLGPNEALYWKRTGVNPYHVISDLDFAIDKLILHGRPHAAIGCIYHQVLSKKDFTPDLAVQALRAGLSSDEPKHAIGAHEIVEVIKALQLHPSATEEDICSVEWPYVGLLDDIHGARPTKLGERLAKSPEFFCELVQLVFRPRNAPKESSEVDEGKRSIATNAYRLLNGWRIPPGVVGKDFFPEKFVSWLEKMIAVSSENGRFEVAMNMLGHCLLYSPADPSGLWIHKAIANALNKLDAQDMRDGFRTAYFNSRGVFSFSKGVQERSLAREFAGKAADLDAEGFVRLAATMRELAATYEKDAERQERRDPYDDD